MVLGDEELEADMLRDFLYFEPEPVFWRYTPIIYKKGDDEVEIVYGNDANGRGLGYSVEFIR